MAFRERVNPQTGKKEYKYRYYFWADGRRHDADTSWFDSKDKAKKEGDRLKEEKERADRDKMLKRRDTLLITAFEKFIDYLEAEAKKEVTISYTTYHKLAKTIKKKYMPVAVQNTKIMDVTVLTFQGWLEHINSQETLGGKQVRNQKVVLDKFNNWLSKNGYYTDVELNAHIGIVLKRVTLKPVTAHNKEDAGLRHILTLVEIMEVGNYFVDKGLGKFENFYWYTLYHVLFFSGMRVEELVGMQWDFLDLRGTERMIEIKNAITEHESVAHALERVKSKTYRTKNTKSNRSIPIFDYYYQLLLDYRESFQYEYKLTDEQMKEAFVFPNISKHDPFLYQRHKTIVLHLQDACKAKGLPSTDSQMLRHSCATFLIMPYPEGLGYEKADIFDYFGHQDTTMLTRIYAKLSKVRSAERMRKKFSGIFTPDEDTSKLDEIKKKEELIARVRGKNEEAVKEARRVRIFAQIAEAEKRKQPIYYYNPKDKEIIEEYKTANTPSISFEEAK